MADKSKAAAKSAGQDNAVQSFIRELQTAPSGDHVLHGMVKPADNSDGLMFAHVGQCERWIYIPATAIQTVQRAGHVACKDHSHMTAAIQLKAPQSDLEKTFASVASLHQASIVQLAGAFQAGAPADPECPPGTTWKQDQWNNWGCWP